MTNQNSPKNYCTNVQDFFAENLNFKNDCILAEKYSHFDAKKTQIFFDL